MPVSDPNEDLNRKVMAANLEVMRPLSTAVKTVLPGPAYDRLHDFNSNLKEPRIFVNNLLQGRIEAAIHTGVRFGINSVFGLAGFFDVASREGIPQQSGDFGQTMFVWGVSEGPYVVQPYLGPATLRDSAGTIVDMFTSPVGWLIGPNFIVSVSTTGIDAMVRLRQLKQAEDASIDFYSFVRSSYYQTRRAQLREAIGQPNAVDSPTTPDDPEPDPADGQRPPGNPAVSAAPGGSGSALRQPPGQGARAGDRSRPYAARGRNSAADTRAPI